MPAFELNDNRSASTRSTSDVTNAIENLSPIQRQQLEDILIKYRAN
jgi:hypothetical protein